MDVPAVRAAAREATLVWICNPNNPTGRLGARRRDRALLEGIEADAAADGRGVPAVVVDEAYSEFTGASVIPLRTRFPNLVAVRTASKAYAMAGLRVGFAVGGARDAPPDRALPAAGLHRHDLRDGRRPPRCATGRRCAPTSSASSGSGRAWPRASPPPAGARSRR